VTKDNVNAPWLNFEAGALGKSIEKGRVCPFLFRIKRSEVEGPVLQFQSTICEKEDVLKLLKSINAACTQQGIDEGRLEKTFDVWWPSLKKELDSISEDAPPQRPEDKKHSSPTAHMEKIMEEVLELSRLNQKLLRSPDELLPLPYLEKILGRFATRDEPDIFEHPAFEDLFVRYSDLVKEFRSFCELHSDMPGTDKLNEALARLRIPMRHFVHRAVRGGRVPKRLIADIML
jgi:hypothetical protein